jgi:hypothetical protein
MPVLPRSCLGLTATCAMLRRLMPNPLLILPLAGSASVPQNRDLSFAVGRTWPLQGRAAPPGALSTIAKRVAP